jgi:hypothetical protein
LAERILYIIAGIEVALAEDQTQDQIVKGTKYLPFVSYYLGKKNR